MDKIVIVSGIHKILTSILFLLLMTSCDLNKKDKISLEEGTNQDSEEYVWLHVEDKYIRKSPLCTDPDGIWIGIGCNLTTFTYKKTEAFRQSTVDWIADKKANKVIINFEAYPGSQCQNTQVPIFKDTKELIDIFIDPYVKAFKHKKIYTILKWGCQNLDEGGMWDVDNPSVYCRKWLETWADIADYYANEPWVAGYEICNEPNLYWSDSECSLLRKNLMRCIEVIRERDTNHIIFVPGTNWSHISGLPKVWENGLDDSEKYNPDPIYKQACFVIHEYPGSLDTYGKINDELARIQGTFNVPFIMAEYGYSTFKEATNWPLHEVRKYMQEIIEVCLGEAGFWNDFPDPYPAYPSRGIPKGAGVASSMYSYNIYDEDTKFMENYQNKFIMHSDIWSWAAQKAASPPPEPAVKNLQNNKK